MEPWKRWIAAAAVVALAGGRPAAQPAAPGPAARRPVTIDDLMALATINDVEIAPAGDRIAYTVSSPSLTANAHEARLFVVRGDRWCADPAGR